MDRVLLLDVMGTLVHEPFFEDLPRHFGMTLETLMAHIHPSAWVEFEHGELDETTYLARFFKDGRDVDGAALKRAMRDSYAYLDGIEALLVELQEHGNPVHALSNYPIWYELIEDKLRLSRYLKWSFVSCNTGVRKPDPQAYLGAAQTLGVAPEQCLFVDDRGGNCKAAHAVGMQAVKFETAPQLREELKRRGWL